MPPGGSGASLLPKCCIFQPREAPAHLGLQPRPPPGSTRCTRLSCPLSHLLPSPSSRRPTVFSDLPSVLLFYGPGMTWGLPDYRGTVPQSRDLT